MTAQVMIRLLGPAHGPMQASGPYLSAFDPDGEGGRGTIETTDDPARAIRFEFGEALATWKRQSTVVPLRPDGKPNRPLTAFHVEIVRVGERAPCPEDYPELDPRTAGHHPLDGG